MLFLLCFVVLGMMLNYAHVVIADGRENNNNSGTERASAGGNNGGNEQVEIENEDFTDENGNNVSIEVRHKNSEEGDLEIENEDFTDENGNNITIVNRDEVSDNNSNGKFNNGEFEVNGVKAKSDVRLESSFENNKTEIKAEVNGKNETVKIMPDKASQTALKALADNGFVLKLIVVGQGNEAKVVYSADLNQSGRILGLLPVDILSNALIDSQTGNVTDLNQPWWGFFVIGKHSV